jgi:LAO/AO transport system kinase
MTCSAKNGLGLEEVWNTIMSFREFAEKSGYFQNNRNQQAIARMFDSINESLRTDFYNWPGITAKIEEYKKKILKNRISSYQAAQELLDYYLKRFNKDAGM